MTERKKSVFAQKREVIITVITLIIAFTLSRHLIFEFFAVQDIKHFNTIQQTIHDDRSEKSNIALITIGDDTLSDPNMQKLFGKFPYPRNIYGYLLRFLDRTQPKVFIIDAAFVLGPDKDHPHRDQAFVDGVKNAKYRVITALLANLDDNPNKSALEFLSNHQVEVTGDKKMLPSMAFNSTQKPFQQLIDAGAEFYPATSLLQDGIGITRTNIPIISFEHGDSSPYLYPNMMLAALMDENKTLEVLDNQSIRVGNHTVDLKGQWLPIIRWYGDVRGLERKVSNAKKPIYKKYPAWNVIRSQIIYECEQNPTLTVCQEADLSSDEPTIDPEVFNDQYVITGVTIENNDAHPTLYGTNYPGVYIQTNVLDNYLHNDFVKKADFIWTLATCLLMVGLAGFVCLKRPILLSLLVGIALAGSYTYFTFWIYEYHNIWVSWTLPMTTLLITMVSIYIYRYVKAESLKQQLRFAFAKYVSPAAMETIEKDPTNLKLGGQRRELTFLFCDIRGFTSFSERHEPEYVQEILTRYFSVMNNIIIHTFNGSINKLMGDALMAYWGFPLAKEDHAFQAVAAAMAMEKAMEKWQSDPNKPPIQVGIGINTGTAMIGNVGSEDFMDFTVIGDSVNIASRLEELTKTYRNTIIMSAETYEMVKDRVEARKLGKIKVRGKRQETEIYVPIRLIDSAIDIDALSNLDFGPVSKPPNLPDDFIPDRRKRDIPPEELEAPPGDQRYFDRRS